MKKPHEKAQEKILDSKINDLGLARFSAVALSSELDSIEFRYQDERIYSVPLEYVLSWYSKGPHGFDSPQKVASVELAADQSHVVLVLASGSRYMIAWDVVLMACEPAYEHFGGFTEKSKANATSWLERCGSFRIGNS